MLRNRVSAENRPGPDAKIAEKPIRYKNASSFLAKGSLACTTKKAMAMAMMRGTTVNLVKTPIITKMPQKNSANTVSDKETVDPSPIGSGKLCMLLVKSNNLGRP
jgi:hypothetical protein